MTGTVVEVAAQAGAAASQAAAGQDPLLVGLAWVAGIVALVVAIGKPIRDYLRSDKRDSAADQVIDAKAGAEAVLYTHLAEQVSQYRTIADAAYKERNDLIQRVGSLEAKAQDLVDARASIENMKARLEEKDRQIRELLSQSADERKQFLAILQAKDAEITRRDERILSLETRQRELEMRLVKDETSMGLHICPWQQSGAKLSEQGFIIPPVPESDAQ